MFLIPAIDLRGGRCVRLMRGDLSSAKIYYEDPVDAALFLRDAGADLIHIVDLDAAAGGETDNRKAIEKIAAMQGLAVQVGGGVRDAETVKQWLDIGVRRVVVGTLAAREPETVLEWVECNPGRICVGIDARGGRVAVKGWTEATEIRVVELARRFDAPGLGAIIYTDIERDGMMTGVNAETTRNIARAVSVPVIASGGVDSLADVLSLAEAPERNLVGVISGRAIYEGKIDLREALRIRKAIRK